MVLHLGAIIMTKVKNSQSDSSRRVNWVSLTYPSDRERVEHLYSLVVEHQQSCVCWCVHDRDVDVNGEVKQAHCHTVIHLNNAMSASAFSTNFCIRPRMFEPAYKDGDIKNLDQAFLYLVHADDKSKAQGKYQYPLESIKGPWATYARERIEYLLSQPSKEVKESQSFFAINTFIDSSLYLSVGALAKWCASNGHWSNFRRSSSIYRAIMEEHNEFLRKKERREYMDSIPDRIKEREDTEALYTAIGMRALRSLDMMLEDAGRPSLKLKQQISYVSELAQKTKGQVNVEIIREMLQDVKKEIS